MNSTLGSIVPLAMFWKWTEVRKYSILSRMQDWPRFTRYLKGVHWAFRVSNKMYLPFVPIWTKDSFLLYLVGHKTQLFIVILQIHAGRKFLGHFALLHRKVANPATTNCSFADSIHESFSYLVFFLLTNIRMDLFFFGRTPILHLMVTIHHSNWLVPNLSYSSFLTFKEHLGSFTSQHFIV